MPDIIIFSQASLIRFSLVNIINNNLAMDQTGEHSIKIIPCSSLENFTYLISITKKAIVIFDIDGISLVDQTTAFNTIISKYSSVPLLVFCKYMIGSEYYNSLLKITDFVLSKTASVAQIISILNQLSLCRRFWIKKGRSMIGLSDMSRVRYPKLSQGESQLLDCWLTGLNHQRVADEMGLNHKTISAHQASICMKYEVKNTDELFYKFRFVI